MMAEEKTKNIETLILNKGIFWYFLHKLGMLLNRFCFSHGLFVIVISLVTAAICNNSEYIKSQTNENNNFKNTNENQKDIKNQNPDMCSINLNETVIYVNEKKETLKNNENSKHKNNRPKNKQQYCITNK